MPVVRGFDSPQVHVPLSEEKKKELDEAAKKFEQTKGSNKPPKETKG